MTPTQFELLEKIYQASPMLLRGRYLIKAFAALSREEEQTVKRYDDALAAQTDWDKVNLNPVTLDQFEQRWLEDFRRDYDS